MYDKNSDRWFELSMIKLDVDVILGTVNDITQQKKAHIEVENAQALLFKSNEDLKRVNNNLERFVSAASHDLQEPLRKISVFSERIGMEYNHALDNKGRALIEKIQVASRRMMMVIKDLLDLSLINQGITEWAEVDLNKTVSAALKDLELLIEEVSPEINLKKLPVIKGNAGQLQQMFYNIIANALKFRKLDGKLIISISAFPELDEIFKLKVKDYKKYWHICIEDNGIGFKDTESKSIFNVFSRLHTKSEYEGTGIGLSIVQKVVENHAGFVRAEGHPGNGANFHIYLPKI